MEVGKGRSACLTRPAVGTGSPSLGGWPPGARVTSRRRTAQRPALRWSPPESSWVCALHSRGFGPSPRATSTSQRRPKRWMERRHRPTARTCAWRRSLPVSVKVLRSSRSRCGVETAVAERFAALYAWRSGLRDPGALQQDGGWGDMHDVGDVRVIDALESTSRILVGPAVVLGRALDLEPVKRRTTTFRASPRATRSLSRALTCRSSWSPGRSEKT